MTALADVPPEKLLAAARQAEAHFEMVAGVFEAMDPADPGRGKVYADALTLKRVLDEFMAEIERRNAVARQVDEIFGDDGRDR